jgi:hypothetical protein
MLYSLKKINQRKYKTTRRTRKTTRRTHKTTRRTHKTTRRTHKKQYGGNFNTEQISDFEERLRNLQFDEDEIEEMIGLLNIYSSCILRKSQTYESIKTKLDEFAQGDFTRERRHQITNQLINLIIKKCEKREPETDTEEEDDD